jgi:futalosine hydrolase
MIGLISSVPEEGKLLIKNLKKTSFIGGKPVHQGILYDKNVIHIISGMGKTNAAHASTILLEKFSPKIVIVLGIGGAYPSAGLAVGDIVVAAKEVYGDEGVILKDGFHGTKLIGIPLLKKGQKKYFNEFPLDKILMKKTLVAARRTGLNAPRAAKVGAGTFVTVSACTGTRKKAFELEERFGALCENMEGASVAHVCAMYDTPVIELRGISNIVSDRDKGTWNIRLAAVRCQEAVRELLKDL